MHKASFRNTRSPKTSLHLYEDDMSTTSSRKTTLGDGAWLSDGDERKFNEEINPIIHTRAIEKLHMLGKASTPYFDTLPEVFEPTPPYTPVANIYPDLPKLVMPSLSKRDSNDNVRPAPEQSVSFNYHFVPIEIQSKLDPLHLPPSPQSTTTIDIEDSLIEETKAKREKKVKITEETTPLFNRSFLRCRSCKRRFTSDRRTRWLRIICLLVFVAVLSLVIFPWGLAATPLLLLLPFQIHRPTCKKCWSKWWVW